jgi:predicted TIM-barrel fold metal-dependent hydrolase
VNLACRELVRCVRELGAVGSFIRPNLVNGHYWHSNYWDPLYSVHEELGAAWGFHEGTGAWYSHMNVLYGENRFYRHVASHWIEMQQALIAMMVGGVFEFHPRLRVGFLEAQNSWVPGLLSRIEWDYPQYRDSHAPYLSLTPKEYFRRNCWAAVEGSEPEIEATAGLIGADRMCVSSDYPHFDSNFPNVSNNVLKSCSRETAAKILMGGAALYGFTEADFQKADRAAGAAASGAVEPAGRRGVAMVG